MLDLDLDLDLDPYDPVPVAQRPRAASMAEGPALTTLVRIVVADDHPLYRRGVVRALEASGGFLVIGEAGDGVTALALIRDLAPDLALLDVRMPILDGVDVVHALALHGPDVPVVLLSAFADKQLVDSGLEAGAAAYVNKTEDRDAICLQVATIAASGGALSPRQLGPRDAVVGRTGPWVPRLTRPEHEVLQLAGKGLDKVAIAQLLDVEEAQIRRRARLVASKLDVDSLPDAILRGRLLGLIR